MTDTGTHHSANANFNLVRSFDAPRDLVWRAWTDPALLARWFGPKGSTTTILTHDPRPGGMTHMRMDMPGGGGTIWARFVYREITEPTRLIWVHGFADAEGNAVRAPFFDGLWPMALLTTARFEDQGGRTLVILAQETIDATPEECATFIAEIPSMNQGWGGSYDQLDAVLASPA